MTYQSAHKTGLFAIVMAGALALVGCDGGDGDDDGGAEGETGMPGTGGMAAISHAEEIQPIWTANCVEGCHEAGGTAAYLDLSEGNAYASIVDVASPTVTSLTLVVPGDPDSSYLYAKVAGTHLELEGGVGQQMPLNPDLSPADPLLQAEQDLIADWIADGAAM